MKSRFHKYREEIYEESRGVIYVSKENGRRKMKRFYDRHFYLDVRHLISLCAKELRCTQYSRNHKGIYARVHCAFESYSVLLSTRTEYHFSITYSDAK